MSDEDLLEAFEKALLMYDRYPLEEQRAEYERLKAEVLEAMGS